MVRASPVRDNYPSLINTVLKRRAGEDDPIGPDDAFFLVDPTRRRLRPCLWRPSLRRRRWSSRSCSARTWT
eukprot:11177876-Lingulodinium_polyedra.AAC.1